MQRSRIVGLAGISLAACLLAAPAWAQDDEEEEATPEIEYGQRAFYLSAAANYMLLTHKGRLEKDVEQSVGGGSASADDSWGLNGRIGYRLSEKLALETQYEVASNIEVDVSINGTKPTEKIIFSVWTGNARYFFGTGRIQPYLIAGAGWGRSLVSPATGGTKQRNNGWVARGGAGVDLYGNRDAALTLEATYMIPPSGQIRDLDYITFSAGFKLLFYGAD
jgi:hypothetical protein